MRPQLEALARPDYPTGDLIFDLFEVNADIRANKRVKGEDAKREGRMFKDEKGTLLFLLLVRRAQAFAEDSPFPRVSVTLSSYPGEEFDDFSQNMVRLTATDVLDYNSSTEAPLNSILKAARTQGVQTGMAGVLNLLKPHGTQQEDAQSFIRRTLRELKTIDYAILIKQKQGRSDAALQVIKALHAFRLMEMGISEELPEGMRIDVKDKRRESGQVKLYVSENSGTTTVTLNPPQDPQLHRKISRFKERRITWLKEKGFIPK